MSEQIDRPLSRVEPPPVWHTAEQERDLASGMVTLRAPEREAARQLTAIAALCHAATRWAATGDPELVTAGCEALDAAIRLRQATHREVTR